MLSYKLSGLLDQWHEKLVYFLLFLFPVAGMSVRHWLSTIFSLLVLLSLAFLFSRRAPLVKEERVLMAILGAYFCVFIISALLNGWGEWQTKHLGVEVRYLFAIPLLLMLRHYPDCGKWLLRGSLLAAIIIGGQAYYDVGIQHQSRSFGIYSPNLFGPFAVLLIMWSLAAWRVEQGKRFFHVLIPFVILAALYGVAMSGSRGAFVGLMALLLIWTAGSFRGRWLLLSMVAVTVVVGVSYKVTDRVQQRVDTALVEIEQYSQMEAPQAYKGVLDGTAVRFEMWRLSGMIFADNPIWGVGRGNYQDSAKQYVEKGLVHPDVATHAHPHNAYVEMLVSRGITGLSVFLLLLAYPLYIFIKTFKQSRETALLGIIHIAGFSVFSLTDASPFIKGNFVVIFLLYLVTFFTWHCHKIGLTRQ